MLSKDDYGVMFCNYNSVNLCSGGHNESEYDLKSSLADSEIYSEKT